MGIQKFAFAYIILPLLNIDLQCDFLEPGGFGETLGNDVSQFRTIEPNVQLLSAFEGPASDAHPRGAPAGSVRSAGCECLVLEDSVGSCFPEFHEMGLKMIKAQRGIFG